MHVEVLAATQVDRPILRRLLELHLYDFSEIDGKDLGPHGEYGYRYLDHYWTEPDRHAFLIRVDDQLAGLAMVRAGAPHEMAEFFVVRKYRRRGVGQRVAADLFRRFPGDWSVNQFPGNEAATTFRRSVIPFQFQEATDSNGITQRFRSQA